MERIASPWMEATSATRGSEDEIRVNTKWLGEFETALRQVLGENKDEA
jgi:hypothetical protein